MPAYNEDFLSSRSSTRSWCGWIARCRRFSTTPAVPRRSAGGGTILTWKLVPMYYVKMADADELTLPLLVHLGMWGSAGIAGGLALALGIGSWNRGVTAMIRRVRRKI